MTTYYALPVAGGNMVTFEAENHATAIAKVITMGGDWSLNIDVSGMFQEIKRIGATNSSVAQPAPSAPPAAVEVAQPTEELKAPEDTQPTDGLKALEDAIEPVQLGLIKAEAKVIEQILENNGVDTLAARQALFGKTQA